MLNLFVLKYLFRFTQNYPSGIHIPPHSRSTFNNRPRTRPSEIRARRGRIRGERRGVGRVGGEFSYRTCRTWPMRGMNYRSDSNRLPRGGRKRADAVRPASSRFFQARTFKERFDKLIGRRKHDVSSNDTGRHKHENPRRNSPVSRNDARHSRQLRRLISTRRGLVGDWSPVLERGFPDKNRTAHREFRTTTPSNAGKRRAWVW